MGREPGGGWMNGWNKEFFNVLRVVSRPFFGRRKAGRGFSFPKENENEKQVFLKDKLVFEGGSHSG